MKRKIYKYNLDVTDKQTLNLPIGYQVLTVQLQKGNLCLWVSVDPDAPLEEVAIRMIPTGGDLEFPHSGYCGTIQLCNGGLVFHVFI